MRREKRGFLLPEQNTMMLLYGSFRFFFQIICFTLHYIQRYGNGKKNLMVVVSFLCTGVDVPYRVPFPVCQPLYEQDTMKWTGKNKPTRDKHMEKGIFIIVSINQKSVVGVASAKPHR